MLLVLAISLLAGALTALIEYAVLLYTCGPFWLGPVVFLKTWTIYSLVLIAILSFTHLVIWIIKPLNRYLASTHRRFHLYFSFAWIICSLVIVAALVKELGIGREQVIMIPIIFAASLCVIILLRLAITRSSKIVFRTLVGTLVIVLLATGDYLVTSTRLASQVSTRNEQYSGSIPNICLLVIDTGRGDFFSSYGYPYPTTPNFDRIASEGLLCQNAYSAATWTPPGHISIFTGKYPSQHGNAGEGHMPDELVSITEVLRDQGYFGVAMYNNRLAGKLINLTQGFDLTYYPRKEWIFPLFMQVYYRMGFKDSGAHLSFLAATKLYEWMDRHDAKMFFYLNVIEPHLPYLVYKDHFKGIVSWMNLTPDKIPNLQEVEAMCSNSGDVAYDPSLFENYNMESFKYVEARYANEMAYLDAEFGSFSDVLRQSGLLDSTLMIVTSDHGDCHGEYNNWGHPWYAPVLFNPILRIPLIMRYPDKISPGREYKYTSNVDILPTVLDLAGYDDQIPDDVSGVDIFDTDALVNRKILAEWLKNGEYGYALYSDSLKLIETQCAQLDTLPELSKLLFNIGVDSLEAVNLIEQRIKVTDRMDDFAHKWIDRIYVTPENVPENSQEMLEAMRALGYIN